VRVTICDPSSTYCQTIDDVLLDTGDFGLRLFRQTLTQPGLLEALEPVKVDSLPLYECTEYGDGSTVWGAVRKANVVLAGEPSVKVPVHIIGSDTSDLIAGTRRACANAFSSPDDALYNGSLGLGVFVQDCGDTCAASSQNGQYYTCAGGTCSPVAVPLTDQVQNPVASLPVDNNGIILMLPSVPSEGAPSATGYLVLGIGTQSNNSPSGLVAYGASESGNFTTVFDGVSYQGFIDSGSNGLFFPGAQIPTCRGGWYCPASTLALNATNRGAGGSPSGQVAFQIANFSNLSASNNAFSNIGAYQSGLFDWGLPFFLGRNVCVGIERASSSLASGPYWAY
jgi:hypothetical protein